MQDKIIVAVRIRPLNSKEEKDVWKVVPQTKTIYLDKNGATNAYTFDYIFDQNSITKEIYETVSKDVVLGSMNGYNGTIFAYGQTSSGKTYTMKGTSDEPGIITLAIEEMFKFIEKSVDREFILRVSYMEIYNEIIIDLLNPGSTNLKILEHYHKGVFVADLKEVRVTSPSQVLQLLESGEEYRHIGATNMNERSSRSHTIFRVTVESRRRNDEESPVRVSTLNLVDLAGSERISDTLAEGERLREGGHINKSLLTLGTVISKLAQGLESVHIPYRDSKLTRILQPALGGNSKTSIICTITPAERHADVTHGTLKFANRAKNITNKVQINEILQQQENNLWKKKYRELKRKFEEIQDSYMEEQKHLVEKIQKLEDENKLIKKQIAEKDEELEQLKCENDDLLQKISDLESENHDLVSQNKFFEKENKYVQEINRLKAVIRKLKYGKDRNPLARIDNENKFECFV